MNNKATKKEKDHKIQPPPNPPNPPSKQQPTTSTMDKAKKAIALLGKALGKLPQESTAYPEDNELEGELDEEELALRDAFNKFDTNKDGVLSKDEVATLVMEFLNMKEPPNDAQLGRIFNKVDLNGDGKIQYKEFKVMMIKNKFANDRYKQIFKRIDTDGDNLISRDELCSALRKVDKDVSDEEVDQIFKSADKDKDGKINYNEFLDSMV